MSTSPGNYLRVVGLQELTMEHIKSLEEAEQKILTDIVKCIRSIRSVVEPDVISISSGIAVLLRLRHDVYEDINQVQHEELALRAIRSLMNTDYQGQTLEWYWNPRQTGDSSEPDLQAKRGSEVVISAEVTTSERPQGIIDSRMRDTLIKLNKMSGRRYYFVRTEAMQLRAETKVSKARHSIEIRKV